MIIDNKNEIVELSESNNENTNPYGFEMVGFFKSKTPKTKSKFQSNNPIYSYTQKSQNPTATIYPNPTKDILNIGLNDWNNQAITLKIFNTLGVLTKQVTLDENHDNLQQLDINTLQNGNYYIFIESGEERSDALKFVKVE